MVYVGSFGCVFAVMMTSLCEEFYQFLLAQGILLGISMGLVTWPILALVGQYIKVKRAAAMGIVLGGSSLGGVIWPVAIDRLINEPKIGFPWTMRIVGFIMIPCLIFSCTVARSPDTRTNNLENRDSNQESGENTTEQKNQQQSHKTEALALLRKPSLQLLCLAMFIIYFGMFSPFFYTTSYAVEQGFSTSLAFYTVSIVNGASFFGRVLPGVIADKWGKFNCCIIATISAGIVALCWTKVTSVAGLVIWCAAYGFASGVSYLSRMVLTSNTNQICRAFYLSSKPVLPRFLVLPLLAWQSGPYQVPQLYRMTTISWKDNVRCWHELQCYGKYTNQWCSTWKAWVPFPVNIFGSILTTRWFTYDCCASGTEQTASSYRVMFRH